MTSGSRSGGVHGSPGHELLEGTVDQLADEAVRATTSGPLLTPQAIQELHGMDPESLAQVARTLERLPEAFGARALAGSAGRYLVPVGRYTVVYSLLTDVERKRLGRDTEEPQSAIAVEAIFPLSQEYREPGVRASLVGLPASKQAVPYIVTSTVWAIHDITHIDVRHLSLTVYRLARSLFGPSIVPVYRFLAGPDAGSLIMRWEPGKGVVGKSVQEGHEVGRNLLADLETWSGCTEDEWENVPAEIRMNLTWHEFQKLKAKVGTSSFGTVIAIPITNVGGRIVGCVALEGPSSKFDRLWKEDVRELLKIAAQSILIVRRDWKENVRELLRIAARSIPLPLRRFLLPLGKRNIEAVRRLIYTAAWAIHDRTNIDVRDLTLSVYGLTHRPFQSTLRLIAQTPPRLHAGSSGIRWRSGKGVIGRSVQEGQDVGRKLANDFVTWGDYTKQDWATIPPEVRLGLSWEEFQKIKGQHGTVIATPMIDHRDRIVGCVVLEGPGSKFDRLWKEDIREILASAARAIVYQ